MGVGPGGVRVSDRAFRVFRKALHPEWFTVRAHERFSLGPWAADVRIVEGGHVVVFAAEGVRISEVLGLRDAPLPAGGLVLESPVDQERSDVVRPGGAVVYQCCREVERVDPEVFRHLCEEETLDAHPGRLFHAHPGANRLAPRPISHIRVDRLGRGLSVQAFHSFPDDLAVLRSQSLFELAPEG